MTEKKRGGRREGAGRPPKSGAAREQKSVNLTPAAWAALRAHQQPGESESDTLERILRALPADGG